MGMRRKKKRRMRVREEGKCERVRDVVVVMKLEEDEE